MTQSEKLTGRPVISATGLFTPSDTITNEELVESFNRYVERHNADNAAAIEAGDVEALQTSSVEFIEKASGIKARHVMAKGPILDPEIMAPRWPERSNEELSMLLESGVSAILGPGTDRATIVEQVRHYAVAARHDRETEFT